MTELNGPVLRAWARRAVAELAAKREEINQLNVFPVPDADTGSNMAHTMEKALQAVEDLPEDADTPTVAAALAAGSVAGARGNSGIILSQVLRALAQTATDGPIGAESLTTALNTALKLVHQAISEPVEGTVITVLRAAAIACRKEGQLRDVLAEATAAARTALANTPSQLDALREAGVVDAGGTGFLILLETLLAELDGEPESSIPLMVEAVQPALEVMCHLQGGVEEARRTLPQMGDSLIIAPIDEETATIHIHSREAGAVIEHLYTLGQVSQLRLEVLPERPVVTSPRRIILAVTPSGEIAELYESAGALTVAPSEDTVSDIVAVVHGSSAEEVILLPNGLLDRRELVSVERSSQAFEQHLTPIPTNRLVDGIAALAVHDPRQPLGVAAYAMTEAALSMRTAIIDTSDDVPTAVEAACRSLLAQGGEQVTLLTASPLDEEALSATLGVEVISYPAQGMGHQVEIGVE